MYDLKEKVVVITGASGGIGAKIVESLLQEGAKHVAIFDIDQTLGTALQDDLNKKYGSNKVQFVKCDVTDENQLNSAFESVKAKYYIDIVINNAGIMNDSPQTYRKSIEINYIALVTSTLKSIELMRKDQGGKGGAVINISSVAGLAQTPLLPIYFGTKSAVLQFSNCVGLPEYYSRTGVRILTVCFGATKTSIVENVGSFDKAVHEKIGQFLGEFPLQSVESAAAAFIEACKQGESGSTWLSNGDKPVENITGTVKKAYGLMSAHVFTK